MPVLAEVSETDVSSTLCKSTQTLILFKALRRAMPQSRQPRRSIARTTQTWALHSLLTPPPAAPLLTAGPQYFQRFPSEDTPPSSVSIASPCVVLWKRATKS